MPQFHGEFKVMVRVGVVVEAADKDAAIAALNDVTFDVSDTQNVTAREWDVEPRECVLFNGAE